MKIFTLLMTAALAATTLFAQAPPEDSERRRGPHLDELQAALNLSDEQLSTLRSNNQAMHQEIREVMQQARESREALKQELEQESPNPSIVGQHIVDGREVRDQIKAIRDQYRATNLAVLDDGQRQTLAEIEAALETARLAPQAARLNLLEGPEGGHHGPQAFRGRRGPGGPGGFGGRHGFRGPHGPTPVE